MPGSDNSEADFNGLSIASTIALAFEHRLESGRWKRLAAGEKRWPPEEQPSHKAGLLSALAVRRQNPQG
jgi:hypothetical protein